MTYPSIFVLDIPDMLPWFRRQATDSQKLTSEQQFMTVALPASGTMVQNAQAVRRVRSIDQRPCGNAVALRSFASRSGRAMGSSGRTPSQQGNLEIKAFRKASGLSLPFRCAKNQDGSKICTEQSRSHAVNTLPRSQNVQVSVHMLT